MSRNPACGDPWFQTIKRVRIAEYFCYRISKENFQKIQFSFDGVESVPRVILKGDTAEVLQLVNGFMQDRSLGQSTK